MSSINVSAQAVRQLIEQDILVAQQLSKLLEQEHQVLQSRDSEQLNRVVAEKQHCMARLEGSAKQRGGWISFLAERTGMAPKDCWLRLLEELKDPALLPLWEEFQLKLNDCKAHNDVNGKIISRGQKTLKQLLGLLRGQSIDTPRLYNASGDAHQHNASHTVIKA